MPAIEVGGVQYGAESGYAKELAKHQKPYKFEKYPQMLFMAQVNPLTNRHEVVIARNVISADKTVVILDAEQFNASCQTIVNNEAEYENAIASGWRESPKAALDHQESLHNAIAEAAAFRAAEDAKMSQKAQAEAKRADESTYKHVAEVKEQPRRRGGRPKGSKNKVKAQPIAEG
jgi:hypothetical protein